MSAATAQVNTKKVDGRRSVHYASLNDLLKDAERLANGEARTIGNWSQGQIYAHLASSLDLSIDGGADLMPAPMRFMLNLLFKKKFLHKAIPAGFKSPAKFVPEETSVADGLALLQRAIARQSEVQERVPHPGFGKISREEWDLFHLRHAEMHMSFIVD
jgi:ribosomal protein S6E (S10)